MDLHPTSQKRRRGRPPGTGKDDRAALRAVADLLIANPALRPSTAMRRAVRNIGDSHLRRLQGKWQRDGACLLAEAAEHVRVRKAAADDRAIDGEWWSGQGIGATGMGNPLTAHIASRSPSLQAFCDLAELTTTSTAEAFLRPLATRSMRDMVLEATSYRSGVEKTMEQLLELDRQIEAALRPSPLQQFLKHERQRDMLLDPLSSFWRSR